MLIKWPYPCIFITVALLAGVVKKLVAYIHTDKD